MNKRICKLLAAGACCTLLSAGAAVTPRLMAGAADSGESSRKRPLSEQPAGPSYARAPKIVTEPAGASSKRPTIYGAVIYSNAWGYDDTFYQMSSFRPLTNITPATVAENDDFDISAGVYINGKYYGVHYTEYETVYNVAYRVWDATTWAKEKEIKSELRGNIPVDLTYDETSGIVYGSFLREGNGYDFGRLNLTTGKKETIAQFDKNIVSIAADGNGDIWAIGWEQDHTTTLYKVDKASGALTTIGDTGLKVHIWIQSATFDIKNNVLYWATTADDEESVLGQGKLFTVDTSTGKATLAGTFVNSEEVSGIYIITPLAEDDAPAAIDNLTADFAQGSLQGTLSFTAPAKTYSGKTLSGTLTYTVSIDGTEYTSGSINAGASIQVPVTLEARGQHTVTVTTTNTTGRSPLATVTGFFGNDTAKAVTGLNVTRTSDNEATISWTAPTESLHDGYLNPDMLRYKIVRQPGDVTVSEATNLTSVTDNIGDSELGRYTYTVTPTVDGLEGEPAVSEPVILGRAMEIPYNESFATPESFDFITVISDRRKVFQWSWYKPDPSAYTLDGDGTESQRRDDWMLLPPLRLDTSKRYTLSFKCKTGTFPEQLEVAIGKTATREGMTRRLIEPTGDLVNRDWEDYTVHFTVDDADAYFIGFHGMEASKSGLRLHIKDVKVEGITFGVPAAPEFTVTPSPRGALGASVEMTVPTETFDGKSLSGVTKVEIYRDGDLLESYENPAMGTKLTYTDTKVKRGMASYLAVAYSSAGRGVDSEKSLFIGPDSPMHPLNLNMTETSPGVVSLSWEASETGEHGGYVDPEKITYEIYRIDGDQEVLEDPITGIKATQVEYTAQLKARQELCLFAVYAVNDEGYSLGAITNPVIIGEPYKIPYAESFAGGEFGAGPWMQTLGSAESDARWELNGHASVVTPQDTDGGVMTFIAGSIFETATLRTPKFTVKGSNDPQLVFYVLNNVNSPTDLRLYVSTEHGEDVFFASVDSHLEEVADKTWLKAVAPLAEFKDAEFIQIAFKGISGSLNTPLYIDNVTVTDTYEVDLGISHISAPYQINSGETGSVAVTVVNNGTKSIPNYTVTLFDCEGTRLDSKKATVLGSGKSARYTFNITPSVTTPESYGIYAEVSAPGDEYEGNNRSETVTVTIVYPELPAARNLDAASGDDWVTLTWDAPDFDEMEARSVLDDVERYDDFAIDPATSNMGGWLVKDVAGSEVGGPINPATGHLFDYPHAGDPAAFMVFNPVEAGMAISQSDGSAGAWAPHSGDKYFVAFFDTDQENDDWLISPLLSGMEQTVSFWVKAPSDGYEETYEFLTSSDPSGDITKFTRIAARKATATWTKVTFAIPRGICRFAIRYTGADAFALMIDDIEYVPESSNPENLELLGYNVYRDRIKLNSDPVSEATFTDRGITGSFTYHVTALYRQGESRLSDPVMVSTSLLPVVGTDELPETFDIFNLQGMLIKQNATRSDLRDMAPGLYVATGRKIMIR